MAQKEAFVSKALRTLGLRLIPGDLLDEAAREIARTLADADAPTVRAQRGTEAEERGIGEAPDQAPDALQAEGAEGSGSVDATTASTEAEAQPAPEIEAQIVEPHTTEPRSSDPEK